MKSIVKLLFLGVSLSWLQGVPAPAVNSLAGSAASAAISVAHHQHHLAHPENWIDEKGWAEIRMNQERAAEQKRQAEAAADAHRQSQQRQMEQQRESNERAQRQAAEESQRAHQRDSAAAAQKAEADNRWAQMQAESARRSQAFISSPIVSNYYTSPPVQFQQPVFQPQPRVGEIVPAVQYVHTPIEPSFFPIFQPMHEWR